jgi:hypothetical protein
LKTANDCVPPNDGNDDDCCCCVCACWCSILLLFLATAGDLACCLRLSTGVLCRDDWDCDCECASSVPLLQRLLVIGGLLLVLPCDDVTRFAFTCVWCVVFEAADDDAPSVRAMALTADMAGDGEVLSLLNAAADNKFISDGAAAAISLLGDSLPYGTVAGDDTDTDTDAEADGL